MFVVFAFVLYFYVTAFEEYPPLPKKKKKKLGSKSAKENVGKSKKAREMLSLQQNLQLLHQLKTVSVTEQSKNIAEIFLLVFFVCNSKNVALNS